MIPRSNSTLGFINGFNGSPVLDEMGNSNLLALFISSIISPLYYTLLQYLNVFLSF